MLSKNFKIVNPKTFEIYIEDVDLLKQECIIKINKAAICKADMRYYIGNRDEKTLGLKYPMSLLHEAIGVVIKDNTKKFNKGDKVVLVPNIIKNCLKEKCDSKVCINPQLGKNYCKRALFASSNYDGFSKNIVSLPAKNVVKFHNKHDKVAIFCELISVCISAIRRYRDIECIDIVAIWGDGILAYIMSAILKIIYGKNVVVFGKHPEKLNRFYCDKYFLIKEPFINSNNLENIKLAIECVGGKGAQSAINQILDIVDVGANIILTGVSENNILINTRKILEKGLILTGSTRSNEKDFQLALKYLNNEKFSKAIKKLIIENIVVKNISDFYVVFNKTEENKDLGKYIIDFEF